MCVPTLNTQSKVWMNLCLLFDPSLICPKYQHTHLTIRPVQLIFINYLFIHFNFLKFIKNHFLIPPPLLLFLLRCKHLFENLLMVWKRSLLGYFKSNPHPSFIPWISSSLPISLNLKTKSSLCDFIKKGTGKTNIDNFETRLIFELIQSVMKENPPFLHPHPPILPSTHPNLTN